MLERGFGPLREAWRKIRFRRLLRNQTCRNTERCQKECETSRKLEAAYKCWSHRSLFCCRKCGFPAGMKPFFQLVASGGLLRVECKVDIFKGVGILVVKLARAIVPL